MEHESFEDEATAALMNELFVNIKVDREERPDIDAIYMDAVQAMTGQGGWPMSVWLTPDGKPFHGGTYYPRSRATAMPSFQQVLRAVADAYHSRRERVDEQAEQLSGDAAAHNLTACRRRRPRWRDSRRGARSDAPIFRRGGWRLWQPAQIPQPMTLDFALTQHQQRDDLDALFMAELTLEKMAHGGIYDQLGGGFHRYSVDAIWLVAHTSRRCSTTTRNCCAPICTPGR
jgi:uncharacterized protein YyaL (SSP411 family)